MKTTLRPYSVAQITDGFVYSELERKGLFGLSGKLTIQPDPERPYTYADGRKDLAVIDSILQGHPLGLIYFNQDGTELEVLDGQQRITSIGRFVTGKFAVKDADGSDQWFSRMSVEDRQKVLDHELEVYICEGTEAEIRDWYRTSNPDRTPTTATEGEMPE